MLEKRTVAAVREWAAAREAVLAAAQESGNSRFGDLARLEAAERELLAVARTLG